MPASVPSGQPVSAGFEAGSFAEAAGADGASFVGTFMGDAGRLRDILGRNERLWFDPPSIVEWLWP